MYYDSSEMSSPLILLSNKVQCFRKQQNLTDSTGFSMKLKWCHCNTLVLRSNLDIWLGDYLV